MRARGRAAKVRAKPEKFADHYTQARLFYESQTPVEQAHIAAAFRFELSKVTVPAVRERMVASLRNASEDLARKVAARASAWRRCPTPLPRALPKPREARGHEVAGAVADGAAGRRQRQGPQGRAAGGAAAWTASRLPHRAGRAGRARRRGAPGRRRASAPSRTADGETVDADASLENEPGFLFDALVLPDGCESAADDARALDSVRDVYRHCKPIFAFGSGADLLARAGIPGDAADAGLIVATSDPAGSIDRFIAALGAPRDFSRETDPPRV